MTVQRSISTAFAVVAFVAAPLAYADHSAAVQSSDSPQVGCVITGTLSIGSRGDEVKCLQAQLIRAGFLRIAAPTGYFGQLTQAAFAAWKGGVSGAASVPAQVSTATSTAADAHAHVAVDATSWPYKPAVSIKVIPDAMSGYNLQIATENFTFAPQHVNGAVAANEGHAHLYINGKKVARVYGPWMHLSADLFASGANDILVTLNANDHSEIEVNGVRIDARVTVTK